MSGLAEVGKVWPRSEVTRVGHLSKNSEIVTETNALGNDRVKVQFFFEVDERLFDFGLCLARKTPFFATSSQSRMEMFMENLAKNAGIVPVPCSRLFNSLLVAALLCGALNSLFRAEIKAA